MKTTVTEYTFIREFIAIRPDQFSVPALRALFDYYEDCEQGSGEELEFDPIAICCDWTEYASAIEAAEAYGWTHDADVDADLNQARALDHLRENTQVLEAGDNYLVLNY
jgi:hypothetical protein